MNQYWQNILDNLVYPISHPQIKTDLALPLSNEKKFEFLNNVLAEDVKLVFTGNDIFFIKTSQKFWHFPFVWHHQPVVAQALELISGRRR